MDTVHTPQPTPSPLVAPAEQSPLVEVRGLSKVYEPFSRWMQLALRSQVREPVHALTDVSFTVGPGEVCAVVGPNGAGKSTLFRVLTGLTTPTAGSASVMGFDVAHSSRLARKFIGFMPSDDRSLFMRHTCRQNLQFHGKLHAIPKARLPAMVDDALEMVGLGFAGERVAFALSSGMRARLQLARALLHRPKIVILDEPTGTIDPVDAHKLLRLIERLAHEQQLAILLSSHRLEEIDALHDNVVFLDRGRVAHWGDLHSLRDLWERPQILVRFHRARSVEVCAARLDTHARVEHVSLEPQAITVSGSLTIGELLDELRDVLAEIASVERVQMPLRDVLAHLVEHSRDAATRATSLRD
jgi:ABC-2 type transport system ATP-binding protein